MTVCTWRVAATNELQPAATGSEDSVAWPDAQLPIPYAIYETGCRDALGDPFRVVGPTPNAMPPGACPVCLMPRKIRVMRS